MVWFFYSNKVAYLKLKNQDKFVIPVFYMVSNNFISYSFNYG